MSQGNRSILGDIKEDDCFSMWNSVLWSTAQASYLGIHLNLQSVYIRAQLSQAVLCLDVQTVLLMHTENLLASITSGVHHVLFYM